VSRPKPILRKEVVDTPTFGELCVKQILAEDRITLQVREEAPKDETELDRKKRENRDYVAFLSELMGLCIVDPKEDEQAYSVDDWKVWHSTGNSDQQPSVAEDVLTLTNKALAMNGYRTLGGEDVAKNA
jgi:hypothetical protein